MKKTLTYLRTFLRKSCELFLKKGDIMWKEGERERACVCVGERERERENGKNGC